MRRKLILILFISICLIGMASAISDLGAVKQNACIQIPQSYANSTYTNITTIQLPDKSILNLNAAMQNNGLGTYNYTFCNTSQLGTYIVTTCTDVDGSNPCQSNNYIFEVNGSGQIVSQPQILLLIIGLVIMIIVAAFFFVLSNILQHPGSKIFTMGMSILTLIVLIGLIASNASVYLAEFPSIVSIYNNYYILITIMAGAGVAGLVVWLIWYALTTFSKSRGTYREND
jgi:hypothetical protein